MTPRRALRFPPSGRADAAALALAVLLGAAASAPSLLLRTRPGWAKCRDEALAPVPGTVEPDPGVAVGPAVAAAEAARPLDLAFLRQRQRRVVRHPDAQDQEHGQCDPVGHHDQHSRALLLVLRRSYDGRPVEASFALHEADPVGGLSSAAPGGPVVDFRTLFVLEEIRAREPGGPPVEVPEFGSDGHVLRDAAGRPLTTSRSPEGAGSQEVVLRGPDDERRILRTP